jgi:uncharacterized protein YrzB (UPF0473 family)
MPINGLLNIGIQVINESNDPTSNSGKSYVVLPEVKSFIDEDSELNGIHNIIRNEKQTNNNKEEYFLDTAGERYQSLPNRQKHEKFINGFIKEVLNTAVFNGTLRENKVNEWRSPESLTQLLDLQLKNKPDSDAKLMLLVQDIIKYSVKTGHPYFVNQLFSGVDPYALAGQWLTDALNPSVYTYEVAPVFILMEEMVLKEMRKIVGYTNGQGDGIFCPGGSIANGYAISCARFNAFPDVKVSFHRRDII